MSSPAGKLGSGLLPLLLLSRALWPFLVEHFGVLSSFKLFLELEPQVRDIIFKFYESKYASCLKMLDEMKVRRSTGTLRLSRRAAGPLTSSALLCRTTCSWTCTWPPTSGHYTPRFVTGLLSK